MIGKIYREMWVGAGILLLALLGIFLVIPMGIVLPGGNEVRALSPDFWPLIVVVAMGFCGGALAVSGALAGRKEAEEVRRKGDPMTCEMPEEFDELPVPQAAARVAVVLGVLFALYFAINIIGMVAATIPVLIFMMWYGGERRPKIVLPVALILPPLLYYFFVYVANVPIPLGVFETLW